MVAIVISVGKILGGHMTLNLCSNDPPEFFKRFIFFTNFFSENIFSPEDGSFWQSAIFADSDPRIPIFGRF